MRIKRVMWLVVLNVFLLGLPMAALAADTKDQDEAQAKKQGKAFNLETMTVQAQKRDENIQDVPMSVAGLSDARLQDSRIYNFTNLDLAVPNLSFHNYGSRTNYSVLSIRGLSTSNNSQDPTVGVYIDEVPVTDFVSLSSPALFDLERVEVLRGPQSTLWGVNTEGGALLIYTKDPGEEWHGSIRGEAGTDNLFLGRFSVGGPLVEDTLYLSLAAAADSSDGHVTNVVDDSSPGQEKAFGVRGKLVWKPNDKLNVKLTASGDRIQGNAGFVQLPLDSNLYTALYGISLGDYEAALDDPGDDAERTSSTQALWVGYQSPWFDIVSVTSHRDVSSVFSIDGDGSNIPSIRTTGAADLGIAEYSQELRFISPEYEDIPLKWIFGLFYLNKEQDFNYSMNYKFMNYPYNFCIAETSGRNTAVFGQATYRLFDQRLGFTAGIRFEEAERSMDRNDDAVFNYSDSKTENEWLPRFIVDYKFTKDLMTYASVSKGWRNGGLNPYAPSKDLIEYDKETAWNYELGFKSSYFENRLRLNAALFYMDVEGYQETIYNNMTSYFGNAEAVTLKGFELELEARPWQGWLFIASFGYTDAVYDEYQYSESVSLSNNTVADTPEYEFSAVAQYTFPFGLYVRGEFFANGDNYLTPENDYKQDSYQLYNARIGYQGEDFEVYLFGENLSDEFYFIDASTLLDGLGYGPVGMGRTMGAGVSYYF